MASAARVEEPPEDGADEYSNALPEYRFDDSWIEQGLQKHAVNYSMVIGFESSDPLRLRQLRRFLVAQRRPLALTFREHEIFEYEPWSGLGKLSRSTGVVGPCTQGQGRFAENLADPSTDLPRVLTLMDTQLRLGSAVLIIHGVRRDTDGVGRLGAAIRSWAFSDELTRNHSLVILFCAALSEILDEETRSQIPTAIVGLGETPEYGELVSRLSSVFSVACTGDEASAICTGLTGLSLRQAEAVLRESYCVHGTFDIEHVKASKSDAIASTGLLDIEPPHVGFAGIGGYEPVKAFVAKNIVRVLAEPARAKRFAVPLPRGILFFGPPGTGKTLFARALATEVHLPFIRLRTENIYSKWVGETGTRLRSALQMAEKMSPAIVFIDEVDRFGRRYGADTSAGEEFRRVFSQILEWLGDEQRRAIIVGTTNRPGDMDEAFLRTGRFDYKIPIGYPNAPARLEILRMHFGLPRENGVPSPKAKPPFVGSDEEFVQFLRDSVVPKTELYSGAELEELARRTKRRAFESGADGIELAAVEETLRSFRLDVRNRQEEVRKLRDQVQEHCDDQSLVEDELGW